MIPDLKSKRIFKTERRSRETSQWESHRRTTDSVNARQGDNNEQLAEAQRLLDEVSKMYAEAQKKAEEAKASTEADAKHSALYASSP